MFVEQQKLTQFYKFRGDSYPWMDDQVLFSLNFWIDKINLLENPNPTIEFKSNYEQLFQTDW